MLTGFELHGDLSFTVAQLRAKKGTKLKQMNRESLQPEALSLHLHSVHEPKCVQMHTVYKDQYCIHSVGQ